MHTTQYKRHFHLNNYQYVSKIYCVLFHLFALGHENVVPLVAVPSCSLGVRLVTKMWSRLLPCHHVRLACAWSRKCGPACSRAIMFAWPALGHENVVPFVPVPSCSLGLRLVTTMWFRFLFPCHHVRLACAWSRQCGSASCSRAIMFAWTGS